MDNFFNPDVKVRENISDPTFEETEDDIIKIKFTPIEANFDSSGDEVIKLHEGDNGNYQEEKSSEEIVSIEPNGNIILSSQEILDEAENGEQKREHP